MIRNFGGVSRSCGGARTGALAVLGALAAIAVPSGARAAQVLASQTNFFTGATSQTVAFDVASGGTVDVHLTDLGWPDPLQSLSFFASTATAVLPSDLIAPNTYEFSLTGAGAFYAHIAGVAGAARIVGLPNFGLYGVDVSFTPLATVPLPAGFSLLASGLVGLLAWRWLRRRSAAASGPQLTPAL
jgi:hypothetical protein